MSSHTALNIHQKRAAITPNILEEFFTNAENDLRDVPIENIINLTDHPGGTKLIFKRETKYAERIVNNNPKAAVSLMFAGTASGHLLPIYMVYKASQL